MTNDPTQIAAALRSFAVFAVCAVLAIVVGVLMTDPMTYASLGLVAVICAIICLPLLLKWHYPLMVLSWSMPVTVFFLKGDPNLYLVMIALSLAISATERAMGRRSFINVPQVYVPLMCLMVVVLITAKLTGGIGLKAFGSDVYGGKKYVFLGVACLGFFAMTARPIPPQKARLYVALFFSGGILGVISDFAPITPHFLDFIYWLVPPSFYATQGMQGGARLAGTGTAAACLVNVLIARYGMRGVFLSGKLWRPIVFFVSLALIGLGGFRSAIILTGLTCVLQFFLEGIHRTKVMPFFVIAGLVIAAATFALSSQLPYSIQRSLAFLPPSVIDLSTVARLDAEDSWNWRINMWQSLLPQIPEHLLLGKGYAISPEDYEDEMGAGAAIKSTDAADQALALASDYHNGPLSVILPFGIWGAIAFLWFVIAALWAVYRNYRYGPPELKTLNAFLFVVFIVNCVAFFGGSLATSMGGFTGLIGLSIAINRGICRKPAPAARNVRLKIRNAPRSAPVPAFPRRPSTSI